MPLYDDPDYIKEDTRNRQAQTQQYFVENIINLVHNGFTAQSAIEAVTTNDLTKLVTKAAASMQAAAATRTPVEIA